MKKIRLLLGNRPQLMREVIFDMIKRQEDMEVVGEVLSPVDLLVAVKETQADAVILSLQDSQELGLCSHLLAEYPHLTILGLAAGSNTAFVEQLCPRRRQIVDPTEAKVLHALRQAVLAPCTQEDEPKNGA